MLIKDRIFNLHYDLNWETNSALTSLSIRSNILEPKLVYDIYHIVSRNIENRICNKNVK